jgi:glutaredoxin-related protein
MTPSIQYQLYVSNKCNCCDKILAKLEEDEINIETINVDTDDYNLPFTLMILPALVKENKLVGYGYKDIVRYIDKD